MIELRALGTLVLRKPNGDDVQSVLAQPKRVALLAYLAIARPRGFHRRDTLLAFLWPEQDEQHARWALNQALRQLRNALGREVVSSRGDEEVGITPGHLWCDAAEFAAAVEGNDPAKALGLYQGDLLNGFHVSGCGEFDRWLEQERTWLRGRAAGAASALALQEEGRGEWVAAGHWARHALTLCPDDEGEARRLIELLGRLGDRAGAIQAYEEFARRLREEYEAEPAPETRALIAAVRARQQSAPNQTPQFSVPGQLPAVDAGRPLNDGKKAATAGTVVANQLIGKRRIRALALSTLLIAGVGAMVWGIWPARGGDAIPDTSSNTIAVFPFAYHGSPEFAYLGEGMVDLLSANLNGAGEIRGVEPREVMALVRQAGAGGTVPEQVRRIADRLNAGSFVLGEVVETGGRLRVSARLRQSGIDEETGMNATVEGLPTQLFQLVDALTVQLLRARSEGSSPTPAGLAAATTDSLTALKAYLEGERAYRAGRFDQAIKAFQRATGTDTSFALGHYRLATIFEGWYGWNAVAQDALDRAVRHSHRLGHQHRMLIQAMVALRENRHVEAERLYRQIVTAYPSDFEAWFQLGHVIDHNRNDGVWLDARGPFEQALALEPRHAPALWRLSQIAARERKRTEVDTLTERLLQFDMPPFLAAYARAQRAAVFADSVEIGRFISLIRRSADGLAQWGAGILTYTIGDLALGRRLWALIAHPSRPRGYRVLALKTLAQIELMNGRWRAAQRQLDTMATLDPATALEHRALFSLWPLQQVPRSELLGLRDSVQRWKAAPGPSDETSLTAEHGPAHPYLRLYLLGLLDARLGDTTAALRHAAELERQAGSAFAPKFVTKLGRAVRAEVARFSGRLEEALGILEPLTASREVEYAAWGNSPFFGYEYQGLSAADLLYGLGRHDEALIRYWRLAAHLFHSGAPAHLRMAQIYERKGERQKAAEHYARFVELWKDCDPEFRPLVEEARRRMAKEPA